MSEQTTTPTTASVTAATGTIAAANRALVERYMRTIWNERRTDRLGEFLGEGFVDHSLPPALGSDAAAVARWVAENSASFEHSSTIDDIVADDETVMIRMTMHLKHIGPWRGLAPTGRELATSGFRSFRIADGRIVEHWGLLNLKTIEVKLGDAPRTHDRIVATP